jgi:hypothetical protein
MPGSVEYEKHSAVVARAGGPVKAWEEVRLLSLKLPDLQKHVEWDKTARAYLKKLRESMPSTTVEWQLDYGGVTDSANKKVSVWSATVISSPASQRKQEHYDFFFDQSPSKESEPTGTAKKDGLTGKFMLGEMLDKEKSPNGDGVPLFATHFPDITDIVLSGDTGNGYRAYSMLQELSKVLIKYGYKVKLIPLAPGYAWNRTDARIAHMNTFLNVVLMKSRVFGALGIAAAFRAASDPRLRNQRKFMARSHIFFVVVKVDRAEAAEEKKLLGSQLISEGLDGGKMGVRGLLYFDFSTIGPDKELVFLPGYARVREHADPDRVNNPTYVYTWRKDLAITMCQQCSDSWGGVVLLVTHGCTKKKCAIAAALAQKEAQKENERVVPGLPLQRAQQQQARQPPPAELGQNKQNKENKKKKNTNTTVERSETRQVRAVHGEGARGRMEIWLYVPENKRDKNKTKRKGWWLYPEAGKPRHYYIGPCLTIQATKTKNQITGVAVFADFPFTRVVKLNAAGDEIPGTVRCVTDRPMTDAELLLAKGGEDIGEGQLDVEEGKLDVDGQSNDDEDDISEYNSSSDDDEDADYVPAVDGDHGDGIAVQPHQDVGRPEDKRRRAGQGPLRRSKRARVGP